MSPNVSSESVAPPTIDNVKATEKDEEKSECQDCSKRRRVCFTEETKHESEDGHQVMGQIRKRRSSSSEYEESDALSLSMQHPYGVKPLGNMYTSDVKEIRSEGLGALGRLDDEAITEFLGELGPRELTNLAQVSRAMYVYASHDALWRPFVFRDFGGNFRFRNSWKQTYLDMQRATAITRTSVPPTYPTADEHSSTTNIISENRSKRKLLQMLEYKTIEPIAMPGIYSDTLFQPWFCAAMGIDESWLNTENIPRVNARDLPLVDFVERFEKKNLPVVITNVVNQWPGYSKWDEAHLIEKYGHVKFRAGPIDITMRDYYRIKDTDENPIYLFDKFFGENAPDLVTEYHVPGYFSGSQDLFSLLGDDKRPDYKWIIIGPKGSGSSFHIDPNGTSAWNGVVKGRKKWILYPPSTTPPGVFPSADGSEVASPVSLNEWYSKFYADSKNEDIKPLECICNEGELMFVPSGWWHAVMNIEDSIAITQNYVSNANLVKVMSFLKNKPEQISGCKPTLPAEQLHDRFVQECNKAYPGVLEKLVEEDRLRKEERERGSIWKQLKKPTNTSPVDGSAATGGFSFGF
eukprot:CFRG0953T1